MNRGMKRGVRRHTRKGTAVVEFALVAPLFFLLVFGIIEFGRLIMVQQIVTNTAREAARMAIIDGANLTSIKNTLETDLDDMSVPNATVTLIELADSGGLGERIEAVVTVNLGEVSWLPGSYVGFDAFTITSNCTMRKESIQ